jgi:hypothetical protein
MPKNIFVHNVAVSFIQFCVYSSLMCRRRHTLLPVEATFLPSVAAASLRRTWDRECDGVIARKREETPGLPCAVMLEGGEALPVTGRGGL